jgi:hypothetical protein
METEERIEPPQGKPPPTGNLPAYSEDGVDLTLIRWMLSLTYDERLNVLQDFVNSIASIRNESSTN